MKKLVGIVLVGLLLVPWPAWGVPLLGPYMRGVIPPDEIEIMAPLTLMVIVYPLIGLVALITLGTIDSIEKRDGQRARRDVEVPGHDAPMPLTDAERRRRDREKRRKRAQAGGDIAMALMLIDDNKK